MTINPGNYNFIIYGGYTLNLLFTWTDQNGNLINLSGYSAILEGRYNLTDANPFLTLSTANGGIVLGGSAGTINIIMSTSATAALTPGVGVYNLKITSGTGEVDPLIQGTLTVQEMPTR